MKISAELKAEGTWQDQDEDALDPPEPAGAQVTMENVDELADEVLA